MLERRETETPWIAGTTLLALARELAVGELELLPLLRSEVEAKRVEVRAGYYCRPEHRPRLDDEQRAFFAAAVAADEAAPLDPVPLSAISAAMQRARIKGVEQAFDMLRRGGTANVIGMIPVGQRISLPGAAFLRDAIAFVIEPGIVIAALVLGFAGVRANLRQ